VSGSIAARPGLTVALLRPVLPVLATRARKPQLFDTMTLWRQIAEERRRPLWEIAVQYEIDASGWSRDDVIEHMRVLARIMHRQTRAAYDEDVVVPAGPFKPDFTAGWAAHQVSGRRLSDDLVAQTVRWAYGAGAGIPGVKTVPGPMGGGGGYIYAALSAVREARGFSDDDLLRGLFVAAGIGAIAFTRTEPTGEVIGCGGEGGICGAMVAAAIAEMAGGDPQQVEDAASLSLQAAVGMPCDPIPGGSCQPCRSRLLAVTTTAHVFADLALAGHRAVLPLHEAIDVADKVGRGLPEELLCTARGGACDTPTAARLIAEYRDWMQETPPEERPPGNLI
jgi:L-serine dehydratase